MIKRYEVRFFAVGNASKGGDAIFIRMYDEEDRPKVVVIDGGYAENGEKIIRYMIDECHLNRIDYVVNTHPDIDHISGLIKLFESDEIRVGKLIMSRPWKDASLTTRYFKDGRMSNNSLKDKLYESFKKAYELQEIAISRIGEENILPPEPFMRFCKCFTILGPSKEHYKKYLLLSDKTPEIKKPTSQSKISHGKYEEVQYDSQKTIEWFDEEQTSPVNETSIVLACDLPEWNILFTGDVGKVGLEEALHTRLLGVNGKYPFDVVQLPHHGSRKNIAPDLLNLFSKRIFYIVSCPPDGLEAGHPSRRLINKLLEVDPDANIHLTQGIDFVFAYGMNLKLFPIDKQKKYSRMDDRPQ